MFIYRLYSIPQTLFFYIKFIITLILLVLTIMRINVMILTIIFLISPLYLNTTSSHAKDSTTTNLNRLFPARTSFTTDFNNKTNQLNLYTSQQSGEGLYLNHYLITNNSWVFSDSSFFSLSYIYKSHISPVISDYNYFVSNSTQFAIVSSYLNSGTQNGYGSLDIFNIDNQNQNISIKSPYSYQIERITKFSNSKDVYFSAYNASMFFIIKYSFSTQNFSLFFHTPNLNVNKSIERNIYSYFLNNKLYILFSYRGSYVPSNINTSIFVLTNNELLYNKTFVGGSFTSFTSLNNGLLLYSRENNTFFDYGYSSNQIATLSDQNLLNNYFLVFAPYNNDSFLALNANQISLLNINYTPKQPALQEIFNYTVVDHNTYPDNKLQAFSLSNQRFYLYSSQVQDGKVEIGFINSNSPPTEFAPANVYPTTTSSPTTKIVTSYSSVLLLFPILLGVVIIEGFLYKVGKRISK